MEEKSKLDRIANRLLEANVQIRTLAFLLNSVATDDIAEEETYKGLGKMLCKLERELSQSAAELLNFK